MFDEEDSGSEKGLKINAGFANIYDSWRQKEEFQKLKTRYGEHIKNINDIESSETSSDEDEGTVLPEKFEKDFYKTLASLKNKDPKIYDGKVKFFDEAGDDSRVDGAESGEGSTKRPKREKKLTLRDYERRIVLERGGRLSDSEDEDTFREKREPTYIEEQRALKESISKVLNDDDDDEESGLFKPKVKSQDDKLKEEQTYKEWLKGQSTEIDNGEEEALKPLRDFWTDPKLDPKEKFLRDYILNKKFLDKDGADENLDYECIAHDSDDDLSEDERNIEEQEQFERKYNFRFEEPDQEFIKRYPRMLDDTLRRKDTRRSEKRADVKRRKDEEKIRKTEELKQLKAMKRKEIADKIAMLKDITGNDDIQFDTVDLEGEFDPAEYDRKMRKIFDEEYYAEPEGNVKPEFPDIDEELGIERTWDDYDPNNEEFVPDNVGHSAENGHCEDPEFNMDADYDPTKAFQSELIDASRKKKKRRRSKFAEVMAKEKPKFDPGVHASYRDYIEQYYALDYEDMIDDLPCRFKYRKVVPNDYGLTIEEILTADDQELNKWCSLKKALEHKPECMELHEVRVYQQKAKNLEFKKKCFKSLYAPEEESRDPENTITGSNRNEEPSKRKRKKKKKANGGSLTVEDEKPDGQKFNVPPVESVIEADGKVPNGKKKRANNGIATAEDAKSETGKSNDLPAENDDNAESDVPNEKKKRRKKKVNRANGSVSVSEETRETKKLEKTILEKSKKRKANVNDAASSGQRKTEEPQLKKVKSDNTADSVRKNSEILPKKSKVDKKKRNKGANAAARDDPIDAGAVDSNGANSDKNMKKKNKKRASGATDGKRKFGKPDKKDTDQVALLSSERLKAYGLNPKKFRNKLKYGKKM